MEDDTEEEENTRSGTEQRPQRSGTSIREREGGRRSSFFFSLLIISFIFFFSDHLARESRKELCMDTAQWPHQGIGLMKRPLEEMMVSSATAGGAAAATSSVSINSNTAPAALRAPQQIMEKKARPPRDQALNCPRCNSTNTKFCYYNNYSMTQPRYFCKTCRRYWTEGGSLRNVPVGGGSRKNKRASSSSSAAAASAAAARNPIASAISSIPNNAPKYNHGQDLNLAFPEHPAAAMSAMDFLRGGMSAPGLAAPYMVAAGDNLFSQAYGQIHQDFRQPPPAAASLHFPLDPAAGAGAGSLHGFAEGSNGRLLFPFEDLRQVPSGARVDEFDQKPGSTGEGGGGAAAEASGFWTGMIGGNGGSW